VAGSPVGIVNAHVVVRVCAGTVYVRDICLQLIQVGSDGLIRSRELNGETGAVAMAARQQSPGEEVCPRMAGVTLGAVMMKGVGGSAWFVAKRGRETTWRTWLWGLPVDEHE
jgi:hypothetical protein